MNEFTSTHSVSRATFAERTSMARHGVMAFAGFIAGLGLIAAAMVAPWGGARAQLDGLPVVGFLNVQPAAVSARYVTAFRNGLEDAGYVEGRQVRIEYRWADGDDGTASMMASELAARRVAVIAATGGLRSAHPAQGGAPGMPALFVARAAGPGRPDDGPGAGRPGRNLTGDRLDVARMAAKRLELLKELMPRGGKAAMLVIPGAWTGQRRAWQPERKAAESQGAVILRVRNPQDFDRDLDEELARAARDGVRGFVVSADPFFTARRWSIVALAAKHGLAALYPWRVYVEAGGLASYGPDLVDVYRQIGMYTGQILKGAQPGGLPVVAPRKWDLTINRGAAAALGIEVPTWLIARANETVD
jgi:putative tryptophan/tyrosine transport system substrate-binding protein